MSYYKSLLLNDVDMVSRHQDLSEFYLQPFNPDLIFDLFSNARYLTETMYGIGEYHHIEMRAPYLKMYSPMSKADIPFGTLDQLIGDCQRFGIEL